MRGQQKGSGVCVPLLWPRQHQVLWDDWEQPYNKGNNVKTHGIQHTYFVLVTLLGNLLSWEEEILQLKLIKNFSLYFTPSCLLCCPWPVSSMSQQLYDTRSTAARGTEAKLMFNGKKCIVIKIVHFFLDTENDPLGNTACSEANAI